MKKLHTLLATILLSATVFSQSVSNTDGVLTVKGVTPWEPTTNDQQNLKTYASKINNFSFKLYNQTIGTENDAFISGYSAAQPLGTINYASTGAVKNAVLNL